MSPQSSSTSGVSGKKTTRAVSEQQVEAARYVLVRRLYASLRHHLVRQLQPIGMIFSVMEHKFADASMELRELHDHAVKMHDFAKAALAQCLDTDTWLAPDPGAVTPIGIGINECLDLLSANLTFRGYAMQNEVPELPLAVGRSALRSVLTGAVLAMSDELKRPATLTLRASTRSDELVLTLRAEMMQEADGQFYDDGYRQMLWSDVEALAAAEGVSVERQGGIVTMVFPVQAAQNKH